MHAAAVKNPAMRGGPFVDLKGKRVDEVRSLLSKTRELNVDSLAFANALHDLNQLLKEHGKGFSLEPLYKEVPELLKGYVELYYDLNHRPFFRLFEALLYHSPFYCRNVQSIALSIIDKDGDRPFILSTPRLDDESTLRLPISFNHPGLDELFKMKRSPFSLNQIKEALTVPINDESLFEKFFTTEAPAPYVPYKGEAARIRYFGHACILIETATVSILLDPVLSYTYDSEISRLTYADLPDRIDYVLITHSHQDHILMETMLQLRHKIGKIVVGRNIDGALQDPSLKLVLENQGFKNVVELVELEELEIPNGVIVGLPFLGEHHDLHIHSKLGYYVRMNDFSIMAVADSCNVEPAMYKLIHDRLGDVDVLFLGMECDGSPASWAYGPLFFEPLDRDLDRSRRGRGCNYKEGIDIVHQFNFKEVYVYAMGQEPWLRHILDLEYTDESNPIVQSNMLLKDCKTKGIVAERLFGEKIILAPVGIMN
jgi:L-ascorbate metabolism protein UlaG (beta-lactamase superfamily)